MIQESKSYHSAGSEGNKHEVWNEKPEGILKALIICQWFELKDLRPNEPVDNQIDQTD